MKSKTHVVFALALALFGGSAIAANVDPDNDLEKYFKANKKRLIHKWNHYFDIYDRHLKKFRGKEIVFLEIGVFHGGSLQMWKEYFGPKAKIVGIDIDPRCKSLEEPQVEIHIGDQADPEFLAKLKKLYPEVDAVLDDGGHTMTQQRTSFQALYPHLQEGGVYLVEDTHTSYWPDYGGGHKKDGTFIEVAKTLIDQLNAYHSRDGSLAANSFTKSANSMHFYDSMVVVERAPTKTREKPVDIKTGTASF